jgi:serine/threonine protein kinase
LSVDSRSSSGKISIDTLSDIFDNEGASKLHGDDFLANWAAPEVIKDAYHSQASDIYSFGLVLWEIIVGIVPFSEVKRQDDIREKVLTGIRPEIPYIFTDEPPYDSLFLPYIDLIKKCWNPEPLLRPNINHILEKLENLYRKQCYDILSETSAIERLIEENNQAQGNDGKPRSSMKSFFRTQNYGSTLHRSSMALSQFDVGQLGKCFLLSFLAFSFHLFYIYFCSATCRLFTR